MWDKDILINFLSSNASRYTSDEDGAVTVDWVVLTAAIVGLAATGGMTVRDGVTSLGTTIAEGMSSKEINNGN